MIIQLTEDLIIPDIIRDLYRFWGMDRNIA